MQGALGERSALTQPDRSGKKGSKRHLLVDGRGVPLSLVVTAANEHDVTQPDQVLQAIGSSARLRAASEASNSEFNRLPKLLVRYEKLQRSFRALNHIAAAIIAFRKVRPTVNVIYG